MTMSVGTDELRQYVESHNWSVGDPLPYWFKDYDTDQRAALAKSNKALPDGSYPIDDQEDLGNAIQAAGRAKNFARAKAWITRRAKVMDLSSMLPDKWTGKGSETDAKAASELEVELSIFSKQFHFPPQAGASAGNTPPMGGFPPTLGGAIPSDGPAAQGTMDQTVQSQDLEEQQVQHPHDAAVDHWHLHDGEEHIHPHDHEDGQVDHDTEDHELQHQLLGPDNDGDLDMQQTDPGMGSSTVERMSDPGTGDMHVPGLTPFRRTQVPVNSAPPQQPTPTMGPQGQPQMPFFLRKMAEMLRNRVNPREYDEVMRYARGHAGGMARASNRQPPQQPQQQPLQMPQRPTVGQATPPIPSVGPQMMQRNPEAFYSVPSVPHPHVGAPPPQNIVHQPRHSNLIRTRRPGATAPVGTSLPFVRSSSARIVPGQGSPYAGMQQPAPPAFTDVADFCAYRMEGQDKRSRFNTRLFIELKGFTEPNTRIPYLPKPGVYEHPKYGTIVITRERNQRFAENMNNHVYQDRIPLDLEHQTKLSGAAAWITSIVMNEDGSGDAVVEWTPMGEQAVRENRFAYISPEWFDEWTNPITNKTFMDVPIGGALCTRPFYKDEALRSLVATEAGLTAYEQEAPMTAPQQPTTTPQAAPVDPQTFAEMQQQFADMRKQFADVIMENDSLKTQNSQFAETLTGMQESTRTRKFTDEVLGRSDENGTRWFGEPEKHVNMMTTLAKAFGEDSDQLKFYVEQQRGIAAQMRDSQILRSFGTAGQATSGSSLAKVEGLAKQFREANPEMTEPKAIAKALSEHPELYDEYVREQDRRNKSSV